MLGRTVEVMVVPMCHVRQAGVNRVFGNELQNVRQAVFRDFQLAHSLEHFFAYSVPDSLDEISELTPEIREALDKHFYY